LLLASDGRVYGVTSCGGDLYGGTAFRIDPDGQNFTVLHEFGGGLVYPFSPLIEASDGNFYGTTIQSADGFGAVYRMTPTGEVTVLHSFSFAFGGQQGRRPNALIQAANGEFYGTAQEGGSHRHGTFFRIRQDGSFKVLRDFKTPFGWAPTGDIVQAPNGNFYGVTQFSGTRGQGTVYRIKPDGDITILHAFGSHPGEGRNPTGLMRASDGKFCGPTLHGGADRGDGTGTLYRMSANGKITTLRKFDAFAGGPASDERLARIGNRRFPLWHLLSRRATQDPVVVGVQAAPPVDTANAEDRAAVFHTTHVLVDFRAKETAPRMPLSGVILADDGNFYGTTSRGGSSLVGTIFRMTPKGRMTTLHEFSGQDGNTPFGGLVQGNDGALYGAVSVSDGSSAGVIYRMALDGSFSVIHVLKADRSEGWAADSALVQSRDGYLYGTLSRGGAYDGGVFYRISPTGEFAVIASIPSDGVYYPVNCQPLEGDDGNFDITASYGGLHKLGGLLRIAPDGTITTIAEFPKGKTEGAYPTGSLVYDAVHERMFGMTGDGVFFRYRDGKVQGVAQLPWNHGQLALGPDQAHFYVGAAGGADKSLYALASSGKARVVANLPGEVWSDVQMIFDAAGTMYGTTIDGGIHDHGTVSSRSRDFER
jgi:uncharacterized repeat protein (TIGR03803 family)